MGDKLPTGNMQGILNWSLAQSDGTSSAKTVSEEDRKWFFEAMAAATVDPVARLKQFVAAASGNPAAALEEVELAARIALLEGVHDLVEDIDVACDLAKVGGLPPLLAMMRDSPHARLRALSAEVVATCVQNNPAAQAALLDAGALDAVLACARSDADSTARGKALLALSCLVRGCDAAAIAFRLGDGFGALRAALGDGRLAKRALFLARYFAGQSDADLATMVELGFVRAGCAALASHERETREAALAFLLTTAQNVDFDALPAALDHFRAPALESRLRAMRKQLGPGTAEDDAEDERALVSALLKMLVAPPPGGGELPY